MTKPIVINDTVRPFRLWDSVAKKNVAHRCYATEQRAQDSALLIVRWEKVGRTIEVYDVTKGKLLGIYKRNLNSISFTKA